MLVLERFENERILIGDDIVIQVVRISRDRVRIGIECPKRISVDREEVRNAKLALQDRKPPIPADAACDVTTTMLPSDMRGLAGAGAEFEMYQAPQDDRVLLDKMRDGQERTDG